MSEILIFRFRRRRANSTMIGGVIVLSLLLTALGTMVFVTRQYDQYEQTVNSVAQYRNQQLSENLVTTSPGLTIVNSTVTGWSTSTSQCGISGTGVTEYNCYDATISNLGTVGVQITRIYINSTGPAGSGCSSPNPAPCIINPTQAILPYAFNEANEFINPGETNHQVILALPTGVALPDPSPAFPRNSILIVTSRGNMFSFQWPFQVSVFGQSQSAFSSGNMKVAYQPTSSSSGGYNSANEPSFTGKATGSIYCHTESSETYPAGAGYAEELTGITGLETGTTLYFVNPWITGGPTTGSAPNTESIMYSAMNDKTTVYIYVVVINTGTTSYTPIAGTIDLTWYGSNHIDGYLFGVYYNGAFYATSPTIPPGAYYYAIFQITIFTIGNPPPQDGQYSVMFWGGASITNALDSSAEGQTFFSGTVLVSGLWIRYETGLGSCT